MTGPALTWEVALDRYAAHLRARRHAAQTIAARLQALTGLAAHVEGRLSPGDVTAAEQRAYLAGLCAGAAEAGSALRLFCAWLQGGAWPGRHRLRADHEDALARYASHLAGRGLALATRSAHESTARRFLRHLGRRRLAETGAQEVLAFQSARAARLAPSGLATDARHLADFLRALVVMGVKRSDLATHVSTQPRRGARQKETRS